MCMKSIIVWSLLFYVISFKKLCFLFETIFKNRKGSFKTKKKKIDYFMLGKHQKGYRLLTINYIFFNFFGAYLLLQTYFFYFQNILLHNTFLSF